MNSTSTLPPNSAYHPSRPPAPPVPGPPITAQKPTNVINRHGQQISSSELHFDRQQSSSTIGYDHSTGTNGRSHPQQTPVGSGGRKSLGSVRTGSESGSQGSTNATGMASLMHQLVSHLHKSNSFTVSFIHSLENSFNFILKPL